MCCVVVGASCQLSLSVETLQVCNGRTGGERSRHNPTLTERADKLNKTYINLTSLSFALRLNRAKSHRCAAPNETSFPSPSMIFDF